MKKKWFVVLIIVLCMVGIFTYKISTVLSEKIIDVDVIGPGDFPEPSPNTARV